METVMGEKKKLEEIFNVSEVLTKEQELLFRKFLMQKEQHTENNIIEAKNSRGPSKKLLILEAPRVNSLTSCPSTKRKRSRFLENVELNSCGSKSKFLVSGKII